MADESEPRTVEEALARASVHGRAAAAEAAAALRSLLDAAAIAASGSPSREGQLRPLAETLDRVRAWLDADADDARGVVEALQTALDEEIERWEALSREDPEARSVLRAFLAVREVLFELAKRKPAPSDTGAPRVQRVPVES